MSESPEFDALALSAIREIHWRYGKDAAENFSLSCRASIERLLEINSPLIHTVQSGIAPEIEAAVMDALEIWRQENYPRFRWKTATKRDVGR